MGGSPKYLHLVMIKCFQASLVEGDGREGHFRYIDVEWRGWARFG